MSDTTDGGDGTPEDIEGAVETAGQVSEVAGSVLKQAGLGDEAEQAGEVLEQVGSAAGAVADVVGAASRGDATEAAGSGVSAASRYIVPEGEAESVLSGAQQAGGLVQGAAGVIESLMGGDQAVEHDLEVQGLDGRWLVQETTISEGVNRAGSAVVHAHIEHPVEVRELLLKECALRLTRGDYQRSFKGVVWHARVHEDRDEHLAELHIVPAIQLLTQRSRSRIFQEMTIPEVFELVYSEALGSMNRSIQNDLQQEYETHEYIVQYQESELAFLARIAEEAGFIWYFDHEGDKEALVLSEAASGLPRARSSDQGQVEHVASTSGAHDREVAWGLHHTQRVGATDVVVAGYDWTHPTLPVRDEKIGRAEGAGPPLEVYDHTDALALTRFNGEQYSHHTAVAQARMRTELLDLARESWEMGSSVLTALPGHTIEVTRCPDAELDQSYLILASVARSVASSGEQGSYSNSLTLVPTSMQYRPPRRTPRPTVYGLESATVVGPSGSEIHTDVHGRVRVHFHWDREHAVDAEDSSCWMRVMQNWAGPGFGTFYLPRLGMEVAVAFMGGNPDRPIVTGCLYNGDNRAGVELDAKKTQSLIRTKSSPQSDGFNELRFEDEAGSEFIYTHAQKDYNEEVENNHSTHVKVDQANTVDNDQTETVGNDQTLHVKNDRKKNVDNDEKTEIGGNRTEEVTGHEQIHIHEFRKTKIEDNEKLVVHGNREMHVDGRDDEEIVGGREVIVSEFDNLKVIAGANRNETITGQKNVKVTKKYDVVQGDTEKLVMDQLKTLLESAKEITLHTGSSTQVLKNDGNVTLDAATKVAISVGGCQIEITTQTIKLTAGPTSLELGPSGATISGPTVTSSAQTMNEITGLLVKIN